MINKSPRGTVDIFGEEMKLLRYVEDVIHNLAKNYSIEEVRTPIFEYTELFVRSVGESSDIVNKEIYTFLDKKNRSLSLRPEGTAGVARFFIENKMYAGTLPKKFYYLGPFFRYEKPQAGRQRQFHQLGVEYYGTGSVYADVEVISLANDLIKKLGIKNVTLEINTLGGIECRESFGKRLKSFLGETLDSLCDDCKERFLKNPMRVFDCKNKDCQEKLSEAPTITDFVGKRCEEDFKKLQEILKELEIDFVVNKKLVRGLDYYTKTVFEFTCDDIGAKSTICGGGRYNSLLEEIGNIHAPAIGFGIGIERLLLSLKNNNNIDIKKGKSVFIGSIGDSAKMEAIKLSSILRDNNIICENDIIERNVKSQMKYANKESFDYAIIIGDSEVQSRVFNLKNMLTGEQVEFNFNEHSKIIESILG